MRNNLICRLLPKQHFSRNLTIYSIYKCFIELRQLIIRFLISCSWNILIALNKLWQETIKHKKHYLITSIRKIYTLCLFLKNMFLCTDWYLISFYSPSTSSFCSFEYTETVMGLFPINRNIIKANRVNYLGKERGAEPIVKRPGPQNPRA